MEGPRLDMTCVQGTTFRYVITYLDEAEAPVNLTGYTAVMHVRSTVKSTTTLLQLSSSFGGITITPLEGKLELRVSPTRSAALPAVKGVYDIKLISPGGQDAIQLLGGNFIIKAQVTRT